MRKRPRKATLADKMEAALARLLGWASWPFVEATRESELNVNSLNAQARWSGASFSCFTYEVDGIVYSYAVRRFWRRPDYFIQPSNSEPIQYNPRNPTFAYYAPAHTLLNNTVAILSSVALVLVVLAVAY